MVERESGCNHIPGLQAMAYTITVRVSEFALKLENSFRNVRYFYSVGTAMWVTICTYIERRVHLIGQIN